jgi:hypothetical protein
MISLFALDVQFPTDACVVGRASIFVRIDVNASPRRIEQKQRQVWQNFVPQRGRIRGDDKPSRTRTRQESDFGHDARVGQDESIVQCRAGLLGSEQKLVPRLIGDVTHLTRSHDPGLANFSVSDSADLPLHLFHRRWIKQVPDLGIPKALERATPDEADPFVVGGP